MDDVSTIVRDVRNELASLSDEERFECPLVPLAAALCDALEAQAAEIERLKAYGERRRKLEQHIEDCCGHVPDSIDKEPQWPT